MALAVFRTCHALQVGSKRINNRIKSKSIIHQSSDSSIKQKQIALLIPNYSHLKSFSAFLHHIPYRILYNIIFYNNRWFNIFTFQVYNPFKFHMHNSRWMKFFSFKSSLSESHPFLSKTSWLFLHTRGWQTSCTIVLLDHNVHRVHRQHSISIAFIRLLVSPSDGLFRSYT